ncbi:polysaccharide export protein [Sphingomonas koreensis]|nr:polysaccharide export protein [Sphingomonas koreensis]
MILRSLLTAILLMFSLAACSTGGGAVPAQFTSLKPPIYTLDAGDRVRVTVYGEQSVNGEYAIGPSGDIALPLIGDVPAKGKTIEQLQQAVAAKLAAGYILDPRVSIEVLNFRPYFILGEVSKPGQYPYMSDLTVDQAVATAGGFTYRASTSKVFVRRAGQAEVEVPLSKGRPIWVKPGDTIRVGERYF